MNGQQPRKSTGRNESNLVNFKRKPTEEKTKLININCVKWFNAHECVSVQIDIQPFYEK